MKFSVLAGRVKQLLARSADVSDDELIATFNAANNYLFNEIVALQPQFYTTVIPVQIGAHIDGSPVVSDYGTVLAIPDDCNRVLDVLDSKLVSVFDADCRYPGLWQGYLLLNGVNLATNQSYYLSYVPDCTQVEKLDQDSPYDAVGNEFLVYYCVWFIKNAAGVDATDAIFKQSLERVKREICKFARGRKSVRGYL